MFCSECGTANQEAVKFCRHCGATIIGSKLVRPRSLDQAPAAGVRVHDPDELTSDGIGSVIMGDGFLMVAVILGVTNTPVSSLLWLFLLIPAFIFFGKGFADVLHAKQMRRGQQLKELSRQEVTVLPPTSSVIASFRQSVSSELSSIPGVTERTTRDLKN